MAYLNKILFKAKNVPFTQISKMNNVGFSVIENSVKGISKGDEKVVLKEVITARLFKNILYTWTDDFSACAGTASSFVEDILDNATVVSEIIQEPTHYEDGYKKYTATFSVRPFVTQTKVETLPAHGFKEPTYTWNAEGTICTAKRMCNNDEYFEEEVGTMTYTIIDATCEDSGSKTAYATFVNTAFEDQSKVYEIIPATGHEWGEPVVVPATYYASGSITKTCLHDPSHKIVEVIPQKVIPAFADVTLDELTEIREEYYQDKLSIDAVKAKWKVGDINTTLLSLPIFTKKVMYTDSASSRNIKISRTEAPELTILQFEKADEGLTSNINGHTRPFISFGITKFYNDVEFVDFISPLSIADIPSAGGYFSQSFISYYKFLEDCEAQLPTALRSMLRKANKKHIVTGKYNYGESSCANSKIVEMKIWLPSMSDLVKNASSISPFNSQYNYNYGSLAMLNESNAYDYFSGFSYEEIKNFTAAGMCREYHFDYSSEDSEDWTGGYSCAEFYNGNLYHYLTRASSWDSANQVNLIIAI